MLSYCQDHLKPQEEKKLYPRSAETTLRDELFKKTTGEYRGAPFWSWSCALKEDELLWQLDVLRQMVFGRAHIHVRTGLTTPYLSDEYMVLVKACVEKCRQAHR